MTPSQRYPAQWFRLCSDQDSVSSSNSGGTWGDTPEARNSVDLWAPSGGSREGGSGHRGRGVAFVGLNWSPTSLLLKK